MRGDRKKSAGVVPMETRHLLRLAVLSSALVGLAVYSAIAAVTREERILNRNEDGTAERTTRITRRMGKRILSESIDKTGKGGSFRVYEVGGKLRAEEIDQDGDGFYETLFIYGDTPSDLEVFIRNRNNEVTVLSDDQLSAFKDAQAKGGQLFEQGLRKLIRPTPSVPEVTPDGGGPVARPANKQSNATDNN